jgi:hypothetical protein
MSEAGQRRLWRDAERTSASLQIADLIALSQRFRNVPQPDRYQFTGCASGNFQLPVSRQGEGDNHTTCGHRRHQVALVSLVLEACCAPATRATQNRQLPRAGASAQAELTDCSGACDALDESHAHIADPVHTTEYIHRVVEGARSRIDGAVLDGDAVLEGGAAHARVCRQRHFPIAIEWVSVV